MIENLDVRDTPMFEVLTEVLEEARKEFLYTRVTGGSLNSLVDFMNRKLQAEIAAGNVRTKFYTPMNRLAEFEGVAVKQDPTDPSKVNVVPLWSYVDDQLDLWEGTVDWYGKERN
jgi:hypothetical protein